MKYQLFFLLVLVECTFVINAQKKDNKLIVGIVVDQMCYDYLYRFQHHFGKDGFNKIMNQGVNCRNVNYNYVPTYTGPGHASIYTGATPNDHGIVANEWYDRKSNSVVNCVTDVDYQTIGSASSEGQRSPKMLKTYTITDQLKLTYPDAKVISISIKDRSAVLPGGHLSDGSYWFDYTTGNMITSDFYKKELPSWVVNFNNLKFADNSLKKSWNTLYPIDSYSMSHEDNSPHEFVLTTKTSATFPYDLAQMNQNATNYSLFTITPFANTFLTDFTMQAIENEELGLDTQTDFLCVSYSTPDIAGHAFGPYSIEIEDMYLRLDLELARLIEFLEKKYGKNGFTLFLTADHAVVPVPQYLVDKKLPGGYLFLDDNLKKLKRDIKEMFEHDLLLVEENQNIYLNRELIDSLHLSRKAVESFVCSEIKKWKGVKQVFSSDEIDKTNNGSKWLDMVQKGYRFDRSGDVIFILEPGYLSKNEDKPNAHRGTSHGSSFNYDTHVPLLWYGGGLKHKEIFRPIEIIDIAPTLTHLLNLQRSGAMLGSPIVEILNEK